MKKTSIKVLIADDEEVILELLEQIMSSVGVVPLKAGDGAEAFDLFVKERPRIIFSDIYMPKKNGLMLLKEVKEVDKNVKVILITGYDHYKQVLDNLETKPDGFIKKPFEIKEIIQVLLYFIPELRR